MVDQYDKANAFINSLFWFLFGLSIGFYWSGKHQTGIWLSLIGAVLSVCAYVLKPEQEQEMND